MAELPPNDGDRRPMNDQMESKDENETISLSAQSQSTAHEESKLDQVDQIRGPAFFGRFQLIRILGRGGMGIVYLANDPKLHRHVALKVMRPEALSRPQERERFLREARAAASLVSDHVVVVYEADEVDGVPYIAQQLLTGCTLSEYQKLHAKIPSSTILRFAREIIEGLCVAHAAGLVHRDIKPSNLWIESPSDRIKILDFGLAFVEHGDTSLTQTGSVLGTPAYMSPEQALGKEVDSTSDLFSVGVVLYQLCLGHLPFVGDNVLATLHAILHDQPTAIHLQNRNIPIEFSEFVNKLLQKDRANRYASATHALAALTAVDANGGQAGSHESMQSVLNRRPSYRTMVKGAIAIILFLIAGLVICNTTLRRLLVSSDLREFRHARALIAELEIARSETSKPVAITYELESGNSIVAIDPPFVIGVFANLYGNETASTIPLEGRKFTEINRDNIEAVMSSIEPTLRLSVPNRLDEYGSTTIELKFRSFGDFEPAAVAKLIPDVAQLIEIRNLASSQTNSTEGRIVALDDRISMQLREVFQHPDFRRLESTWLGLRTLTQHAPTGSRLKIRVLNARKKDLMDDILLAENSSKTNAFKVVFETEYGVPGGEPFALLIADYEVGNETDEVYLLSSLGKVAEFAGAPIVLSVSPNMFTLPNFADMDQDDLEPIKFNSKWQEFRKSPEAKFVGLTLPRFVARLPYSSLTENVESFVFTERRRESLDEVAHLDDVVWMSGVWPFAIEVANAFGRDGWPARFSGELGGGKIDYLPQVSLSGTSSKSMDTLLSQSLQVSLISNGFMPFDPGGPTEPTMLLRAQSCAYDSRLNELLCAASFLRVIRMIARDSMGSFVDIADMSAYFTRWLDNYCIDNLAEATEDERRRRPLLDGSIFVATPADSDSAPILHLKVRPHYLFDPPPLEPIEFTFPLPKSAN